MENSILLVTDNEKQSASFKAIFESIENIKFSSTNYKSLKQQKLEVFPQRVFVFDFNCGESITIEALKNLTLNRGFDSIISIVLTPADVDETVLEGLEKYGANDFIQSPTSPAIIKTRIHTAFRNIYREDLLLKKEKSLRDASDRMTHDISTPLTIIAGHSRKMLSKRVFIEESIHQIIDATGTISDLLASSKKTLVGDASETFSGEWVDLDQLIEETIQLHQERLDRKKIRLNLSLKAKGKIYCDPLLFKFSVLSNVLSNAIKFSHQNAKIDIATDTEDDKVLVTVCDYGVGMSDSKILKINGDKSVESTIGTTGEEGHGFGLSIAQRYLSSFGGSLKVQKNQPDGIRLSLHFLFRVATD
ncbi:MAG: hypothetical protein HRU19_24270 [Pseudobacteriovorax sp.]|nr:hypothetical protein [Pseudobacteriovorax sp.]